MQPIQRTIGSIKFDQVMTEVLVTMGDLEIVSLISCNSAERMGL
jgi:molybdopterin-binding protein